MQLNAAFPGRCDSCCLLGCLCRFSDPLRLRRGPGLHRTFRGDTTGLGLRQRKLPATTSRLETRLVSASGCRKPGCALLRPERSGYRHGYSYGPTDGSLVRINPRENDAAQAAPALSQKATNPTRSFINLSSQTHVPTRPTRCPRKTLCLRPVLFGAATIENSTLKPRPPLHFQNLLWVQFLNNRISSYCRLLY